MKKLKLVSVFTAAVMCLSGVSASAASVVFKGSVPEGSETGSVTIALYNKDTDLLNVRPEDIKYLNQEKINADGTFKIAIPLDYQTLFETVAVSNVSGDYYEAVFYASGSGTDIGDGTQEKPYTLEKAIELAPNGAKIIVDGRIELASDFVWEKADKKLALSGINDAMIDIRAVSDLEINTDAVFENLTFGNNEDSSISANGNHVVIRESVKTENLMGTICGGSRNGNVKSTNLEIYGGNYKNIWGGGIYNNSTNTNCSVTGDCRLTVGGNTNSAYSVNDHDNNFLATAIHGGGYGGEVGGDCVLTVTGNARGAYVYASPTGETYADVKGRIILSVEGGAYMNVFLCDNLKAGAVVDGCINMTGGTVETLATSDNNVTGNIVMNLSGGVVSRRIFVGSYNDSNAISNNYHITGNVTMIISNNFSGMTDKQLGHGIFGGSRTVGNNADEITKLIFLDGLYKEFEDDIGCDPWDEDSHHDYVVAATVGGDIAPKGTDSVTIIPDSGYKAEIDGEAVSGEYTLLKALTNVEFTIDGESEIISADYGITDAAADVNVNYRAVSEKTPIVVVGVYTKSGSLINARLENGIIGAESKAIEVSCEPEAGGEYIVKAMLWKDRSGLTPLCSAVLAVPR